MNGRCHPPPPPKQSIGQHRSKPTDHPAPTTTDRSVVGYGGRTTDEWMGDTSLWHHRTLSVSLSVSVTHSSCVCLSSLSLMSDQSIPNFSEYLSMSVSVNFSPLIPSSSLHLPVVAKLLLVSLRHVCVRLSAFVFPSGYLFVCICVRTVPLIRAMPRPFHSASSSTSITIRASICRCSTSSMRNRFLAMVGLLIQATIKYKTSS